MARYRRSNTDSGISLECETDGVPADGRYHVTRNDQILSSHNSLKAGTAAYLKLIEELGFSPKLSARQPQPNDGHTPPGPSPRLFGDFYVYGKSKRRKTGTRTFG